MYSYIIYILMCNSCRFMFAFPVMLQTYFSRWCMFLNKIINSYVTILTYRSTFKPHTLKSDLNTANNHWAGFVLTYVLYSTSSKDWHGW